MGIAVIVSCVNRSTNLPFSLNKLLNGGFIREKDFIFHFDSSHFSYILAKIINLTSMASVKQVFSRFTVFQLEIMNKALTNGRTIDSCTFGKQYSAYFLAKTGWKPNKYSPDQIVITRGSFSRSTAPAFGRRKLQNS